MHVPFPSLSILQNAKVLELINKTKHSSPYQSKHHPHTTLGIMSDPNASSEQQKVSGVVVETASPAANEAKQEWDVNEGKNLGIASESSLSRYLW